jgi:hypothetical protein
MHLQRLYHGASEHTHMECPRNVLLEETHKFCRDLRIQKTNKYRIRLYTEKVKHSLALLFLAPAVL